MLSYKRINYISPLCPHSTLCSQRDCCYTNILLTWQVMENLTELATTVHCTMVYTEILNMYQHCIFHTLYCRLNQTALQGWSNLDFRQIWHISLYRHTNSGPNCTVSRPRHFYYSNCRLDSVSIFRNLLRSRRQFFHLLDFPQLFSHCTLCAHIVTMFSRPRRSQVLL